MAEEVNSNLWVLIQTWLDAQPFTVSQRQLAKKLDVSPGMLTYWKTNQGSPNPESLNAIVEVTAIPKSALIRAMLLDQGYVDDADEADAI